VTAPERPRRRGSLRVRVALAAAGAIVVAVSVLGAGVQILLSNHLHAELDSTLRKRAVQIAQLNATAPALLTSAGVLDVPAGPRLIDVEVVDRHRRIVARSLGLQGGTVPAGALVSAAISSGRGGYGDASLGGRNLRLYVAPLAALVVVFGIQPGLLLDLFATTVTDTIAAANAGAPIAFPPTLVIGLLLLIAGGIIARIAYVLLYRGAESTLPVPAEGGAAH